MPPPKPNSRIDHVQSVMIREAPEYAVMVENPETKEISQVCLRRTSVQQKVVIFADVPEAEAMWVDIRHDQVNEYVIHIHSVKDIMGNIAPRKE